MRDELVSKSFRAGLPAVLLAFGLIAVAGCSASNTPADGSGGHTTGSGGGTAGGNGAAGQSGSATGSGGAIPSQGSASDAGDSSDAVAPAVDGAGGISGGGGSVSADASVSADVVVLGGPKGTNIALKKPATASSIEHVGREPGLICDGDQVTRWVGGSAVYPQWNDIDLQAAHNVSSVVIYPYMSRAYQFLLEGSLDGTTYFTLSDKRDNTVGGLTITVSFAAQHARFVRITVSGASGYAAGWTAINELELYETP